MTRLLALSGRCARGPTRRPAVTVLSEDGRTLDFKVENKKNLDGVKVGDRVEITYTQALVISVK